MHYAISDVHGCYREFIALLDKINFNKKDILYVIGDTTDRGEGNVEVLKFMMQHKNIIPLLGNHELMALQVLPAIIGKNNDDINVLMQGANFRAALKQWYYNGGTTTVQQFLMLPPDEQQELLQYMQSFKLYERITIKGINYLLIHSLPDNKDAYRHIDDGTYSTMTLLFGRPEFDKPEKYTYDENIMIVIGHTPTAVIPGAITGRYFKCGNIVNIDCGCVSGRAMGALCLETGNVVYTRSLYRR